MSSKPTIVLVPGSFSPREGYAAFSDHIRFYGYEIEHADIPSIGRREGLPPATMADDAAYVRGLVQKELDAGKSVVLVAHSYGGIPATESLKGLTAKERGAGKPAVERVIYTTAVTPAVGTSLQSLMAELEASYIEVLDDGYMKHTDLAASGATNYSNLPKEEQIESAKRFNVHSAVSFAGELTHPGYADVPVTYLLATQDKTIPPPLQERLIQIIKDAGADVTVVKFEADHAWPASVPRSTAFKVLQAIDPSIK